MQEGMSFILPVNTGNALMVKGRNLTPAIRDAELRALLDRNNSDLNGLEGQIPGCAITERGKGYYQVGEIRFHRKRGTTEPFRHRMDVHVTSGQILAEISLDSRFNPSALRCEQASAREFLRTMLLLANEEGAIPRLPWSVKAPKFAFHEADPLADLWMFERSDALPGQVQSITTERQAGKVVRECGSQKELAAIYGALNSGYVFGHNGTYAYLGHATETEWYEYVFPYQEKEGEPEYISHWEKITQGEWGATLFALKMGFKLHD